MSGGVGGFGAGVVSVTYSSSSSPPPPRLPGSDRDMLLGLELLPREGQRRDASLLSKPETGVAKETGGGAARETAVGDSVFETANGGPAENPSLAAVASNAASVAASSAEATPDAGDRGDVSRPALHPFDSLSSPLTIDDCFVVAQQQSRGVLAEVAGSSGVKHEGGDGEGRPRQWWWRKPRPLAAGSSRDARGRVRLGYVSGDLMGTHPLTHLMQAREHKACCNNSSGLARRADGACIILLQSEMPAPWRLWCSRERYTVFLPRERALSV